MQGMGWGSMDFRTQYIAELGLSMAVATTTKPRWQRYARAAEWHVQAHRPLLAARAAFLAEWHRAVGTVDVSQNPRNFAVLTGIAS